MATSTSNQRDCASDGTGSGSALMMLRSGRQVDNGRSSCAGLSFSTPESRGTVRVIWSNPDEESGISDSESFKEFLAEVKREYCVDSDTDGVKQECSLDFDCDQLVTVDHESPVGSDSVVIGGVIREVIGEIVPTSGFSCEQFAGSRALDSGLTSEETKQDDGVASQKQSKMKLRSGKLINHRQQANNMLDGAQHQPGMKTTSSMSAVCYPVMTVRRSDETAVAGCELESQLACDDTATTADTESLSCYFSVKQDVGEEVDEFILAVDDHGSLLPGSGYNGVTHPFDETPCDENVGRLEPASEHGLMELPGTAYVGEQLKTSCDSVEDSISSAPDILNHVGASSVDETFYGDENGERFESADEQSLIEPSRALSVPAKLMTEEDLAEDSESLSQQNLSCTAQFGDEESDDGLQFSPLEHVNERTLIEPRRALSVSEKLMTADVVEDSKSLLLNLNCTSPFDDEQSDDRSEPLNEYSLMELHTAAAPCEQMDDADEGDQWSLLPFGVEDHSCVSPLGSLPCDENDLKSRFETHAGHDLPELHATPDVCEQLKTSDDAVHSYSSVSVDIGVQVDQSAGAETQHCQVIYINILFCVLHFIILMAIDANNVGIYSEPQIRTCHFVFHKVCVSDSLGVMCYVRHIRT